MILKIFLSLLLVGIDASSSPQHFHQEAVQFTDNFYNTDLFTHHYFPTDTYSQYVGLDDTALFSSSVSINENFAVVGSNGYNVFEGVVHVYVPTSLCSWTLQSLIRSPSGANDNFGSAVAIDGLTIFTGANARASYTGIVYVFEFVNNNFWKRTAILQSPMGMNQGFGCALDVSGDYAIVATSQNNAFIYENRVEGWTLTASLMPPAEDVFFGRSVAIEGEYAVVGADQYELSHGAVYVYKVDSSDPAHPWRLLQVLSSVQGENTYFGHSVGFTERTIVVGAVGYRSGEYLTHGHESVNNTGWIHIYDLAADNSSFSLSQSIQSPAGENSYFGASVAISDIEIIVGANGYPAGSGTGASFVYRRNSTLSDVSSPHYTAANWELVVSLTSLQGALGQFGYITDITKDYAAVGSYGYDDLRGGITLVCRSEYAPKPVIPPVELEAPTSQPTSKPTHEAAALNVKTNSGGGNKDKWPIGLILAMMLGGVALLATTALILYCCCCGCLPPAALDKKKKKKKEDEQSPYTVHGPGGLMDEAESSVYSEEFLSSYDDDVMTEYSDAYSVEWHITTRKVSKGKKDKKKEGFTSPYKVYSYAKYATEQADGFEYFDHSIAEEENKDALVPTEKLPESCGEHIARMASMDRSKSIDPHSYVNSSIFSKPRTLRTASAERGRREALDRGLEVEADRCSPISELTEDSGLKAALTEEEEEEEAVRALEAVRAAEEEEVVRAVEAVRAAEEATQLPIFTQHIQQLEHEVNEPKVRKTSFVRFDLKSEQQALTAQLATFDLVVEEQKALRLAQKKEQEEADRQAARVAEEEETRAQALLQDQAQVAAEQMRLRLKGLHAAEQAKKNAEERQRLDREAASAFAAIERVRAKEQSRLRAEETANARFAAFKSQTEQTNLAETAQVEPVSAARVSEVLERAKSRISLVEAQLASSKSVSVATFNEKTVSSATESRSEQHLTTATSNSIKSVVHSSVTSSTKSTSVSSDNTHTAATTFDVLTDVCDVV